jgi:hypothetical protein
MTARGIGLRICWDHDRGCCEAGPPPSMPRCRVSIHENLERILWLRKRRRRKRRRRRRRPRSPRSEFSPGWSAQLRPGSQLRVRFWRMAGLRSAFLIPVMTPRCSPDERSRVEERRGNLGHAATLRFLSPLIKPDVPVSGIRLSDWIHCRAHGSGPRCTRRSRSTPRGPKT